MRTTLYIHYGYVCGGVWVHICGYTCTRVWRPKVKVHSHFLSHCSLHSLGEDLSMSLEFTSLATGASQKVPVILFLCPQSWHYRHALPSLFLLCGLWGIRLGSTFLHIKHFTEKAVFLPNFFFQSFKRSLAGWGCGGHLQVTWAQEVALYIPAFWAVESDPTYDYLPV
jgi:hypothetical protein